MIAALADPRFWFSLSFTLLGLTVASFALGLMIAVNVPIGNVLILVAIGFWCGWGARAHDD